MQNTISCPSCQRELRVPDEFIGTQVKCGACDAVFTATGSAGASGKDSSGQARGGGYLQGDEHVKEDVRPRPRPKRKRNSRQAARDAVLAPAICIMALGGIEIVFYIIYGIAFSGLMSSEAQEPQMPQMPRRKKKGSGVFVRRAKAYVFSGCDSHPATFAPAGSNRSDDGGDEIVEAFDAKCRLAVPRVGRP